MIKKKKGRPPKIKSSLGGDTSITQNISMNASKSSEVSDKDLNLNELKNSHKRREDSPFIHVRLTKTVARIGEYIIELSI